ncbi:chloramphenicol phosphotransferase [Mesorhizobium sp. M1148]|uniref:chloramphenicol phosphotransferase CPT family protein n=1 Tax=unclassified Mesorhizobium TaxID=325217 RepID=UPI0003CED7E5|nr:MULTISPECIES: chloramphenicol phosphotransferase [unclassified Mesorhizobium]ESW66161.1 chloramphenicol phosphotransferase [Mesorhizobium sp. LSJC277A00]ESX15439.1 chloramphenicol phosphotransferase [Mesorhizobium sp. LSJC255A00]ESX25517.1 chloramphenicol phosphotransferase [Mesorhizobium sp. LSHC440B00]ESX33649.1 chloramphenicol phosphotransferase [Mesorhizobium sp. LSHC432A00]ESX44830.1 chloramphenicol phosphotransferase [Mesorhizobium sp. LSHC440A00]
MTAKIVLLNGVGSAGKSSIARALQTIATEPFLHVQMDAFIDMLPPALQDHADGFSFETVLEDGKPSVVIRSGPVGARAMRGMRHAIAAMAGQGNNLIVDDVIFNDEIAEHRMLLSGFDLHLVGVMAPLEVLGAREAARADRLPGLARWQYGRVHNGIDYDLEVDTSRLTPLECARRIQERFRL